jgi:hypothetical protein
MSELLEIKTTLVRLEGEMRTMAAEVRSGDRDSASSVRLLSETVKNLAENQREQRDDLKDALSRFDERTEALRIAGEQQASAVRTSLEAQLRNHETDDAPHAKTLGARIDQLEKRTNQALGAAGLLGLIGLGNVITLLAQNH